MDKFSKFDVGQVVRHCLFGYRGVIFDVDAAFCGTEQWYEQVAKSSPPKDQPWYRVLPDGADHTTYVAERNLEPDRSGDQVAHPLVNALFADFADGGYIPRGKLN